MQAAVVRPGLCADVRAHPKATVPHRSSQTRSDAAGAHATARTSVVRPTAWRALARSGGVGGEQRTRPAGASLGARVRCHFPAGSDALGAGFVESARRARACWAERGGYDVARLGCAAYQAAGAATHVRAPQPVVQDGGAGLVEGQSAHSHSVARWLHDRVECRGRVQGPGYEAACALGPVLRLFAFGTTRRVGRPGQCVHAVQSG